MHFLIFGAPGAKGVLIARKSLLFHGYCTLILYVRSAQKLPADLVSDKSVIVIEGQTISQRRGRRHNTTGRKGSIRPYSHHQGHVRRLIVLTPPTVRDPRTNSACWPLVVLRTTFATFVRNVARDIVAVGDVVRSVGADLYCLAGLHPSDSDTNEVIAGYMGDGKTISVSLRAGAAAFVIQELEKREWVRKASMLSAP
ncbi:hypothetical protein B0H10DRAFT_1805429 [Mycena sp. CBHHK59/15]|nr:hypothetical protein B0H10DRAFT_1805429 [Mycena sp. CBHHK59/15]